MNKQSVNSSNKLHRVPETGDIEWFSLKTTACCVATALAEAWGEGHRSRSPPPPPPLMKHNNVEMEPLPVS